MKFRQAIEDHQLVLTEGAIYERTRRDHRLIFDERLAHGGLIYDPLGQSVLGEIHHGYMAAAAHHELPIAVLTDTWRCSADNIRNSALASRSVNRDNALWLRSLADDVDTPVYVGGNIGPKGDAYKASEALSRQDAVSYHRQQVYELAAAGVDFLMASTLPALSEAQGMAEVMATTGLPYVLSFVVRANGTLLDGISINDAVRHIDEYTPAAPLYFAINCVHSDVLRMALADVDEDVLARIRGFQANTSRLDPEALVDLDDLDTETPSDFVRGVERVRREFDLQVVGGCCGTLLGHIDMLAGVVQKQTLV